MSDDFTPANLPYGVADGRAWVAIRDVAVDLHGAAGRGLLGDVDPSVFLGPLNRFMALGPDTWREVRRRVQDLAADPPGDLVAEQASLTMALPFEVGDYVDAYAGLHHATNLGRILRPGTEPLNPNWRHLPVMYHGRSGTIVPSGTPIERPQGQRGEGDFGPSTQLDVELELGVVVGTAGRRLSPSEARRHVFGYVLVNDWSARDIQAWEYVPLGPMLGKSFATSISPWVVPAEALEPFLVEGLASQQDPPPLEHLGDPDPRVPDLRFTLDVDDERISEVDLAPSLYWTPSQLLAHLTSNGATTRPGDLVATGTISGPDHETQAGSLIERWWRTRFLDDGDVVTMRGWAGDGDDRVGFGPLTGEVTA